MKLARLPLFLFALWTSACGGGEATETLAGEGPDSLAELAVEVAARVEGDTLNAHRSFMLADGAGMFFYDAAAGPSDDAGMGLSVYGERVLEGWSWWLEEDSTLLGVDDRARANVRPDYVVRTYVESDSSGFFARLLGQIRGSGKAEISERITPLDHEGALLVEVPDSKGAVAFQPIFEENRAVTWLERGQSLLVSRLVGADTLWTAVRAETGTAANRQVSFSTPGSVVIVSGRTPEEADSLAVFALRNASRLKTSRGERMAALIGESYIRTEEEQVNNALAWARLTLDALVIRDSSTTVMLPGIPGADPLPGRSMLSNVPALLAIGEWETARGLLATYGRAQLFDERIDILGRAPNIVLADGEGEFSTSDATPIYLGAAGDYVRTTGDRGLVSGGANFWFKTAFAMRGLYLESNRHGRQIGGSGFLRAAEGETWMQSSTSRAELATPRTGFPIEAQGALYRSLRAASDFATIMGVARREGSSWYADSANALLRDFPSRFFQDGRAVDRLDNSGQPDDALRPNVVLALRDFDLPLEEKARLTRAVAERLAFASGLSSRSQTDSLFHPYLNASFSYPASDALFNGTIWTWLNGPLISLMTETGAPGIAAELFGQEIPLVDDTGLIGAIPDNLDGHPRRKGDFPVAGGAPVQPWSLAEFVRNAYEDFVGITYLAADTVSIEPHLPESWGETEVRFRLGGGAVVARMEQNQDKLTLELRPEGNIPPAAVLQVRAFGMEHMLSFVSSSADSTSTLIAPTSLRVSTTGVELNGEAFEPSSLYSLPDPRWWAGFEWLAPIIPEQYPVMRTQAVQRLLAVREILRDNPSARAILTETDPDGDDWGATSTYTYPPDFPRSILDAAYLEVAEDDSATYFRAEFVSLSEAASSDEPLTFAAIVLSTEEGGANRVGRNALYDFPRGEGYEYVIFIGDGILVEDERGRTIGEVPPGQGIAFDEATGSLSFALPRFVLPDLPRNSIVTLLVGAREATGDVGEFRSVNRVASGRFGGGKIDSRAPNVYDVVSARVSR